MNLVGRDRGHARDRASCGVRPLFPFLRLRRVVEAEMPLFDCAYPVRVKNWGLI